MTESALARFGLTVEEVMTADAALQVRNNVRDQRVCICGHPMARHAPTDRHIKSTDEDGKETIFTTHTGGCQPSKMSCPCAQERVVLTASDIRPFLRKTQGGGRAHALMRGIAALEERGGTVEWMKEPECDHPDCSDRTAPVTVQNVNDYWQVTPGVVAQRNVWLCRTCMAELNTPRPRVVKDPYETVIRPEYEAAVDGT